MYRFMNVSFESSCTRFKQRVCAYWNSYNISITYITRMYYELMKIHIKAVNFKKCAFTYSSLKRQSKTNYWSILNNPHCLVLVGSRNWYERVFTIKLTQIEGIMVEWQLCHLCQLSKKLPRLITTKQTNKLA